MKINEQDTLSLIKTSLEPVSSAFLRSYAILIGPEASYLYQVLKTSNQTNMSFKDLCLMTNLNLAQVNNAIDDLYHVELLEIKVSNKKQKDYRIQFKTPLSLKALCTHDVLGRQLLKKIGSESFEKLKLESEHHLSDEGYQDYQSLDARQKITSWSAEDEKDFNQEHKPKHETKTLAFDLIGFLNQCSPLIFPNHKRTELALSQIAEIGAVYGLSVQQMIQLVGKASAKNDDILNVDKLRKFAAKVDVEDSEEKDDPYEYPPAIFLKRLRKGIAPTSLEKYLLVKLVSKDGLKPEVLNVLLESHFKQYRSKINTKVLEETAIQWAVLNVHTKEEALKKVSEQTSKGRRVEVKTDYVSQKKDLSEAELIALEKALKDIK